MKLSYLVDLFLRPVLNDLKEYDRKTFRHDLFSAISIALLTIPQSIAYSLLANLPPTAGLFSAIFGTIFVGSFCSSKYLIAGPTTAIAVIIQTSIADVLYNYYPQVSSQEKEALVLQILGNFVLIMSVLQIIFGLFKFGKILQFVSKSVILGYFFGVIFAILVNQLFPFLGISQGSDSVFAIKRLIDLFANLTKINLPTALLGIFGLVSFKLLSMRFPRFPNALWMVIMTSILAYFANKYWLTTSSITTLQDLGLDKMPKVFFALPYFDLELINRIFPAALAITMLGILEVYSVSQSIAIRSGHLTNSNQDVLSFGISNTFLSFLLGAMPASSSISRSLFNFKNKGKTRFAQIFSGIFVAILIILFWPFIKYIPQVALSAILIALVPTFIDYKQLKLCFTVTKEDGLVFLLTTISCLLFSLHIAIFIGVAISIASYLRKSAVPHVVEYAFNPSGRLVVISKKKRIRRQIRIIGIAGEMFFGSVDLFQTALQQVADDPFVKVIVLRLNNIYHMDASMCLAILNLHDYLKKTKRSLIISGITPEVWQLFGKAGIIEKIGSANLFFTDEAKPQLSTWNACIRAKDLIV